MTVGAIVGKGVLTDDRGLLLKGTWNKLQPKDSVENENITICEYTCSGYPPVR